MRIDDIDPERSERLRRMPSGGHWSAIGLFWDRRIVLQSRKTERYAEALATIAGSISAVPLHLLTQGIGIGIVRGPLPRILPGEHWLRSADPHAERVRAQMDASRSSIDCKASTVKTVATEVGDFVVRRRDGAFAYHLATVLDDHDAGVTEVVRGLDLLASTPRQIYLQRLLSLHQPEYCHVPILVGADRKKLSKSTNATSVDLDKPGPTLYRLLVWLGQTLPNRSPANQSKPSCVGGVESWAIDRLAGRKQIAINRGTATGDGAQPT